MRSSGPDGADRHRGERGSVALAQSAQRNEGSGEPAARITCGGCGTVLAATARFCSECGLRQSPGSTAPRQGAPRSREFALALEMADREREGGRTEVARGMFRIVLAQCPDYAEGWLTFPEDAIATGSTTRC